MTYFIKRFDRLPRNKRIAVEDFTQLLGLNRDIKYESSLEKVADVVKKFCTFPKIEFVKLFKLTLFSYLTGNEDMHLKNFSLITRGDITALSPVYDLVNSSIAIGKPSEGMALPLKGKKNNITKNIFLNYFAKERLGLNDKTIEMVLEDIRDGLPKWHELIENSFISEKMKMAYVELLDIRAKKLGLMD